MKITFYITILFSLSFIFQSCNKDDGDPIPDPELTNCKVKEWRDESNLLLYSIEYTNEKVTKIKSYESGSLYDVMTIIYDGDTIRTRNADADDNTKYSSRIKIGSNGYAEKEITIKAEETSIMYDTMTYTYNSDYLIKTVKRRTFLNDNGTVASSSIHTYDYVISNGNMVSDTYTNTGFSVVTTRDYYTDVENKNELDIWGFPSYGLTIYGKANANPIKKSTSDVNNYVEDFSYEYDKNGYIINRIYSYSINDFTYSEESTLVYTCQ